MACVRCGPAVHSLDGGVLSRRQVAEPSAILSHQAMPIHGAYDPNAIMNLMARRGAVKDHRCVWAASTFDLCQRSDTPPPCRSLFDGASTLLMRKEAEAGDRGRQAWDAARAEALQAIAPKDPYDGSVPPPGTALGNLLAELDAQERATLTGLAATLESHQLVPPSAKATALRDASAQFSGIRDKILEAASALCTRGEGDVPSEGAPRAQGMAPAGAGDDDTDLSDKDADGDEAGDRRVRPKRSVTTTAAYADRIAAVRAAFDDEDTPLGAAATQTLRSWMLDHFLSPYPSDADKGELSKATGLKRIQVRRVLTPSDVFRCVLTSPLPGALPCPATGSSTPVSASGALPSCRCARTWTRAARRQRRPAVPR